MGLQLYERCRPKTLDDVVGQDKAVARIRAMAERGSIAGRAFWLAGQSGVGKTTLARIIAGMIADDFFVLELDAQDVTPSAIRQIEQQSALFAWGKGGRAVICNEAHGLPSHAVRQLLTTLERIPAHMVWVFTTTRDGQDKLFEGEIDAHPLLSRCIPIPMTNQGLCKPFAQLAHDIAEREGLNGQPLAAYERLAKLCKNNLRAMLQEIDAGTMLAE